MYGYFTGNSLAISVLLVVHIAQCLLFSLCYVVRAVFFVCMWLQFHLIYVIQQSFMDYFLCIRIVHFCIGFFFSFWCCDSWRYFSRGHKKNDIRIAKGQNWNQLCLQMRQDDGEKWAHNGMTCKHTMASTFALATDCCRFSLGHWPHWRKY